MNAIILDDFLKEIVEAIPTVSSYTGNDVYDEWNNKEIKYASVAFNVESVSINDNTVVYNGILYYGDRLNEDGSNAKAIQTDAATTITNIIEYVNDSIDFVSIDFPVEVKLFEQTFADKLAGGYANVEITVENDLIECGYVNKVKETLNITENGTYNVSGYDFVTVNVEGGGGITSASNVIFEDGENAEVKVSRKTEKVRVDIVPDGSTYKFMLGTQELNFADLNNMLQNTPDFVVFVHDNREHRCVRIELDSTAKFMEFTSPIIEGVNTKAQSFLITSIDGTQISNVKRTDIINENKSDADNIRTRLNKIDETIPLEIIGTDKGNLEISDKDGNVVVRFKDGDIQTKNFNSGKLTKKPYQRRTVFQYLVDCDSPIKTDLWTIKDLDTTPVQKKEYMDRAVLYLPETYTPDGSPTKIILYCKPGASEITPSSDPILGYTDAPVMHYLIHKGYAVLSADGVPDEYAAEINICERVVGNYIAVQSIRKAYDYVAEHYNIDTNGAYVYGYSQGGHFAQNIVDLSGIKIIAAAEVSPVCSMRFHQWDLSASGNIGGVQWTKLARLNIARLFDFPSVSTNAELLALAFDQNKVQGYDPWTRNVVNLYTGFAQGSTYGSNLWKLPSGTSLDSITMRKQTGCPLKIWCAENDNSLGVDVMKVFVKAIKNAGCVADLTIYSTGGHKIQSNQASIGKFVDNGEICDLIPLAYEVEAWYNKFGGEKIK